MPDDNSIGIKDMKLYGYKWSGMLHMLQVARLRLFFSIALSAF